MTEHTVSESEMKNLFRRVETLEQAQDRLAGVTNGLVQAQSVFSYKHDQAGIVSQKLENLIDKISERGEEYLQNTIHMLDEREKNITRHIQHYRELLELEMSRKHENATSRLDVATVSIKALEDTQKEHAAEIKSLQKIIWLASGITVAVITIVEYALNIIK